MERRVSGKKRQKAHLSHTITIRVWTLLLYSSLSVRGNSGSNRISIKIFISFCFNSFIYKKAQKFWFLYCFLVGFTMRQWGNMLLDFSFLTYRESFANSIKQWECNASVYFAGFIYIYTYFHLFTSSRNILEIHYSIKTESLYRFLRNSVPITAKYFVIYVQTSYQLKFCES